MIRKVTVISNWSCKGVKVVLEEFRIKDRCTAVILLSKKNDWGHWRTDS
jgi:hypothetical protein